MEKLSYPNIIILQENCGTRRARAFKSPRILNLKPQRTTCALVALQFAPKGRRNKIYITRRGPEREMHGGDVPVQQTSI